TNQSLAEDAKNGEIYDSIVLDVDGEKVGVFGLTTEDTANIASPMAVNFHDYVEKATEAVSDLEDEGIDKIIALTHIGYNSAPKVGNDLLLAENVDGIDIIVGGHSHTKVTPPTLVNEDTENPTVIVQAGQYGEHLGTLSVTFDEDGKVIDHSGEVVEIEELEHDVEAEKGIEYYMAKVKEHFPETVIGFHNGGGIRAPIDEGPITVGEGINVLPSGNGTVIAELTGQEINDILEHSVKEAPEEHGGFLHVSGMEFYYDSTKEVGNRIVAMYVKDGNNLIKINLEQEYLVTTNGFTGQGGDGFETFAQAFADGRVRDIGE